MITTGRSSLAAANATNAPRALAPFRTPVPAAPNPDRTLPPIFSQPPTAAKPHRGAAEAVAAHGPRRAAFPDSDPYREIMSIVVVAVAPAIFTRVASARFYLPAAARYGCGSGALARGNDLADEWKAKGR